MKSWSINGPASAAVTLTNIMGHLWHEGAPMHHSRPPKTSEYGYSSVRRGKTSKPYLPIEGIKRLWDKSDKSKTPSLLESSRAL